MGLKSTKRGSVTLILKRLPQQVQVIPRNQQFVLHMNGKLLPTKRNLISLSPNHTRKAGSQSTNQLHSIAPHSRTSFVFKNSSERPSPTLNNKQTLSPQQSRIHRWLSLEREGLRSLLPLGLQVPFCL